MGVIAAHQQDGVGQGTDEVTYTVDLGVEGAKLLTLLTLGAADLALQGVKGGGGLGELTSADVLGDDAITLAAFAVVVAAAAALFPAHRYSPAGELRVGVRSWSWSWELGVG
jgi:hypothetical protein